MVASVRLILINLLTFTGFDFALVCVSSIFAIRMCSRGEVELLRGGDLAFKLKSWGLDPTGLVKDLRARLRAAISNNIQIDFKNIELETLDNELD